MGKFALGRHTQIRVLHSPQSMPIETLTYTGVSLIALLISLVLPSREVIPGPFAAIEKEASSDGTPRKDPGHNRPDILDRLVGSDSLQCS